MAYADMAALYISDPFRQRAQMCIREQGYVYSGDADAAVAALGSAVVSGDGAAIDAVLAATVTAPGAGDIEGDDQALLSSVQAVWPTVAAALFPEEEPV